MTLVGISSAILYVDKVQQCHEFLLVCYWHRTESCRTPSVRGTWFTVENNVSLDERNHHFQIVFITFVPDMTPRSRKLLEVLTQIISGSRKCCNNDGPSSQLWTVWIGCWKKAFNIVGPAHPRAKLTSYWLTSLHQNYLCKSHPRAAGIEGLAIYTVSRFTLSPRKSDRCIEAYVIYCLLLIEARTSLLERYPTAAIPLLDHMKGL